MKEEIEKWQATRRAKLEKRSLNVMALVVSCPIWAKETEEGLQVRPVRLYSRPCLSVKWRSKVPDLPREFSFFHLSLSVANMS